MNSAMIKHTLLALALAALIQLSLPVHARHDRTVRDAAVRDFATHQVADRRVSMDQAIASVQRRTGGRVLDARDLGDQYRIKVLTRDGEVRVVYVDARTGAMR